MQSQKILPLTMISGFAIVAVVVVVYSLRRSNPTDAPSDAIHATLASPVSAEFDWVRDLVRESEFDPPLTSLQQQQLESQCELIMTVYMDGDSDEYLEMIDSWGGWLREGYDDEIVHNRWTQASSKFPWVEVEQHDWTIGRTERMPDTGAIDHTNEEFDGMMAVQSSLFDFGDDRKILNMDYNASVSFQGVVRSADGSRSYVHMLFVWSPSLGRWLPSSLVNLAPKGDSLPRIVF